MKEKDIILTFYPPSPATKDFSVDFLSTLDKEPETASTNDLAKNAETTANVQPTSTK